MKILFLTLNIISFAVTATQIDTNRSAALVDPAEQSQWQQTQKALVAVLSKKSGIPATKILNKYTIDEDFASVVLRSYYQQLPDSVSSDPQWFNVVVDEQKTQQKMLSSGIPMWPDNRGLVYVSVVEAMVDEPLAYAQSESKTVYWLKQWFTVMGVPVVFYDPQAEDLLAFKPEDVRYLNPDLIDQIKSEGQTKEPLQGQIQDGAEGGLEKHSNDRLQAKYSAVLLVFVEHHDNGFSYRFGWVDSDQPATIKNLKFVDLMTGMKSLANWVQGRLSQETRLNANEFNLNTVALTVNDISDANAMLKLLDYFDQHALIDDYQISQLKSAQLRAMVRIKVLPETFTRFIDNEGLLLFQPVEIGQTLLFKWLQ